MTSNTLRIILSVPEKYCLSTEEDSMHCETSLEYKKITKAVSFTTLTNQQRFEAETYNTETPVVKESTLEYTIIPEQPTRDYR